MEGILAYLYNSSLFLQTMNIKYSYLCIFSHCLISEHMKRCRYLLKSVSVAVVLPSVTLNHSNEQQGLLCGHNAKHKGSHHHIISKHHHIPAAWHWSNVLDKLVSSKSNLLWLLISMWWSSWRYNCSYSFQM